MSCCARRRQRRSRSGSSDSPRGRDAELLADEYRRVRELVRYVDWTEAAAMAFGGLEAELERSGCRIDDMDVAIASVAATLGASVATCNVRHFARVPGLVVEDWAAPPAT